MVESSSTGDAEPTGVGAPSGWVDPIGVLELSMGDASSSDTSPHSSTFSLALRLSVTRAIWTAN